MEQRDWPRAVNAYSRLLELQRSQTEVYVGALAEALLGRGFARLEAGEFYAALEDLAHAKEQSGGALEPYFLLARAYYENGEKDETERVFAEFYDRCASPEDVAIWIVAFYRFGDPAAALRWVERVPTRAQLWMRADLLANLGQTDESIAAGEKAVEENPEDPLPHRQLARACIEKAWQLGNTKLGRQFLERGTAALETTLQLDSTITHAHAALGGVHLMRGSISRAHELFAKEISLHPTDSLVFGHIGACWQREGYYEEAVRVRLDNANLGEWLAYVPRTYAGRALTQLGRLSEARKIFARAIAQKEDEWLPHFLLAECHVKTGEVDPAIIQYREALEYSPPDKLSSILLRIADCLFEFPESAPELVDELLRDLELRPDAGENPAALNLLALLRLRSVEYPDMKLALNYVSRAVAGTGRQSSQFLTTLAMVHFERGEKVEAVLTLEEALELQTFRRDQGKLLDRYRREAMPWLPSYASIDAAIESGSAPGELLENWPDDHVSSEYDYLKGRALAATGQSEDAAAIFRQLAADRDGHSTRPLRRLVEALSGAGESASAERALRDAIEGSARDDRELWNAWLRICFVGLELDAEEIRARFPAARRATRNTLVAGGYRDDLLWLLDQLDRDAVHLRINCGGDEDMDVGGTVWSRDRFFVGGYARKPSFHPIAETEIDAVYQHGRFFRHKRIRASYHVPLPPGKYRVTLHFAETRRRYPLRRNFDVSIEDAEALREYDTAHRGYATADKQEFSIDLLDGLLDIRFAAVSDASPTINAIEIESMEFAE